MMSSRELVEAALHVLVAWNDGRTPPAADLEKLLRAYPSSGEVPPDELACRIIHELSGRAFLDSGAPAHLPGKVA